MERGPTGPMPHVAGLVSYDGTDYHGFQTQVGVPTIQGELEAGLRVIAAGYRNRVVGAGRTDSGVHARGQVIATHVPWRHSLADLRRAWSAQLPPEIGLERLVAAPSGFHPRFSAFSRTYRYWVCLPPSGARRDRRHRAPLTQRYALFVPHDLDLAAMNQAAASLVGEHDFAAFGQPTQGETTVRRLFEAEWRVVRHDLPELGCVPDRQLVFTVTGTGFLRRMVRNMVGSLLEVGCGRWSPATIAAVLAAGERQGSAAPAPARGLVLEQVTYPAGMDPFG